MPPRPCRHSRIERRGIKDLEGAGADEKLAEVVVTIISTAISDQVATKAEFKAVRVDMEYHRNTAKADLEDAKKSMIIILGTMIVDAIGAVAVFVSALAVHF